MNIYETAQRNGEKSTTAEKSAVFLSDADYYQKLTRIQAIKRQFFLHSPLTDCIRESIDRTLQYWESELRNQKDSE